MMAHTKSTKREFSHDLGPMPWSSRVLEALSCYLRLILKHSDTKRDTKREEK